MLQLGWVDQGCEHLCFILLPPLLTLVHRLNRARVHLEMQEVVEGFLVRDRNRDAERDTRRYTRGGHALRDLLVARVVDLRIGEGLAPAVDRCGRHHVPAVQWIVRLHWFYCGL